MKLNVLKWFIIGFISTLVVGGAVTGLVTLKPWDLLNVRQQARTQHVFALDLDQAIVPEHSTNPVQVEITSDSGVSQVQLWVNGQLWSEETFDPPQTYITPGWSWTPSGEGQHELQLRYTLVGGEQIQSSTVQVLALSSLDVLFPVEHSTQPGDTLASIAAQYQVPLQRLYDSNPGLSTGENDPLEEGLQIIVPVSIPNAPPGFPTSGDLPAPPLKTISFETSASQAVPIGDVVSVVPDLPPEAFMSGFQIVGGLLKTSFPVDQLYLYYRLADAPWSRSPSDPHAFFLPGANGLFDVSLAIDLEQLQKLPEPVPLDLEAWGWIGGELVFLGVYHDMVGGPDGSLTWPPEATQLKALNYTSLGKSVYQTTINLSGDQPTLTRNFHFSTSETDAAYVHWQVSSAPFNSLSAKSGLLQSGNRPGTEGKFTLNFRNYFTPLPGQNSGSGGFQDSLLKAIEAIKNALSGTSPAKQVGWPLKPTTFYVRVIPMNANGAVGKASNTIIVNFMPAGIPIETSGVLEGPVFDAKIISFSPFRPADSAYAACFKTNYEVKKCTTSTGGTAQFTIQDLLQGKITQAEYTSCVTLAPKGQLSCGCPGVACDGGGGDSCSLTSLQGVGNCLQQGGEYIGSALKAGYDFIAENYNDAVAFLKEMVAKLNPLCIQAKLTAGAVGGETVTEKDVDSVCKAVADIAVTAAMTYFGLPPSLPDFDKLADEGLDYAIGVATSQMGFECNKQCRDLIKKGFNAVTSGENLLQAGLDVGASMAAEELQDLGIPCDKDCENLIKDGVQGKATFGQVSDLALKQAAAEIAKKYNEKYAGQGPICDQGCEDAIYQSLQEGKAIGDFAGSGAGAPQSEPWLVPHELAYDQEALIRIEVFRRWESADIPDADVAKCSLSLYNQASNATFSTPVQANLFNNEGIELPVLEPGESMIIPVVLKRVPWFLPAGVTKNFPPASGNVVYASLLDPVYGAWYDFYRGAQLSFNVTGPNFLTLDGQGGTTSIPCVTGDSYDMTIPASP